jgi:hypothetical protein
MADESKLSPEAREAMLPSPPRNIRDGEIAEPAHTAATPMPPFDPPPEKPPSSLR